MTDVCMRWCLSCARLLVLGSAHHSIPEPLPQHFVSWVELQPLLERMCCLRILLQVEQCKTCRSHMQTDEGYGMCVVECDMCCCNAAGA